MSRTKKYLEEKIDKVTGYRIRKFINKDGYLFDRGYEEEDVDKKVWMVDHPNFTRSPIYFKKKKDLTNFLKKIKDQIQHTNELP